MFHLCFLPFVRCFRFHSSPQMSNVRMEAYGYENQAFSRSLSDLHSSQDSSDRQEHRTGYQNMLSFSDSWSHQPLTDNSLQPHFGNSELFSETKLNMNLEQELSANMFTMSLPQRVEMTEEFSADDMLYDSDFNLEQIETTPTSLNKTKATRNCPTVPKSRPVVRNVKERVDGMLLSCVSS